jgi:hypothetical protein
MASMEILSKLAVRPYFTAEVTRVAREVCRVADHRIDQVGGAKEAAGKGELVSTADVFTWFLGLVVLVCFLTHTFWNSSSLSI